MGYRINLVNNSALRNNINNADDCYLLSTHVWVRNSAKCFKGLSCFILTTSSWRWANLISILHRQTLRLKSLESGGEGFAVFHQGLYAQTVQKERREGRATQALQSSRYEFKFLALRNMIFIINPLSLFFYPRKQRWKKKSYLVLLLFFSTEILVKT